MLGTVGPGNESRALPFTWWTHWACGIKKQITGHLVIGVGGMTVGQGAKGWGLERC